MPPMEPSPASTPSQVGLGVWVTPSVTRMSLSIYLSIYLSTYLSFQTLSSVLHTCSTHANTHILLSLRIDRWDRSMYGSSRIDGFREYRRLGAYNLNFNRSPVSPLPNSRCRVRTSNHNPPGRAGDPHADLSLSVGRARPRRACAVSKPPLPSLSP